MPKIGDRYCFRKEDVSRFLDSLRHRLRSMSLSLRYFLTCEYGEEGYRSHYHLVCLLYGDGKFRSRHEFNGICQALWPYGFTYDGTLTPYSILYVTSYALKDDEYLERDWKDFPEGKPSVSFRIVPDLDVRINVSTGGRTTFTMTAILELLYVCGSRKVLFPQVFRLELNAESKTITRIYTKTSRELICDSLRSLVVTCLKMQKSSAFLQFTEKPKTPSLRICLDTLTPLPTMKSRLFAKLLEFSENHNVTP